jgi:hypothetical protein
MQAKGTLKPDADPEQLAVGLMAALQGVTYLPIPPTMSGPWRSRWLAATAVADGGSALTQFHKVVGSTTHLVRTRMSTPEGRLMLLAAVRNSIYNHEERGAVVTDGRPASSRRALFRQ